MENYILQYKALKVGFGDIEHSRIVRANEQRILRKQLRWQNFEQNRKLLNVSPGSPTEDSHMIKLRKCIGRKIDKRLEDAKKKPLFKVGIVRHAFYSPIPKYLVRSNIIETKDKNLNMEKTEDKKGITKATEKRLLAKAAIATNAQETNFPKNATKKRIQHLQRI